MKEETNNDKRTLIDGSEHQERESLQNKKERYNK